MGVCGNKSRTLKQLLLLSWLAPVALTIVASSGVFLFLGWLDFQNSIDVTLTDLRDKSQIAARRVSAELLLQEHGAADSVLQKLQAESQVGAMTLTNNPPCAAAKDVCSKVLDNSILVVRLVPQVRPPQYLVLNKDQQSFSRFLNLKFLGWSTLPVFFLMATGLVIQMVFLQRKVLDPVKALVGAGDAKFSLQEEWPVEVKQIGGELKAAFEAKEQAVFALLAKGVIHDIKTFMHSLLIATDMIGESSDKEKRMRRLENLYTASKTNLPKIKRIIELTLDGSSDIPINKSKTSVNQTIEGAVVANASYAAEKSVVVEFAEIDDIVAAHDPVQLERAIANLIRNGIEVFSGYKDESKRMRKVRVSVTEESSESVRFNIEDSGPGFEGETDNFMPVKSTKAHGAGLGLYITNKIIEGHLGKLHVMRSEALGGAKFSISLPKGV